MATKPSSGEWDKGNFAAASGEMLSFTDKRKKPFKGPFLKGSPNQHSCFKSEHGIYLIQYTLKTMKLQLWRGEESTEWEIATIHDDIVELLYGTTLRLHISRLLVKKIYIMYPYNLSHC